MSQKHKNRRATESPNSAAIRAVDAPGPEKSVQQTQRTISNGPPQEPHGLTWQPILVMVMIGVGFLVVLLKILGLF